MARSGFRGGRGGGLSGNNLDKSYDIYVRKISELNDKKNYNLRPLTKKLFEQQYSEKRNEMIAMGKKPINIIRGIVDDQKPQTRKQAKAIKDLAKSRIKRQKEKINEYRELMKNNPGPKLEKEYQNLIDDLNQEIKILDISQTNLRGYTPQALAFWALVDSLGGFREAFYVDGD